MGQLVDLVRHGHGGDHRAHEGDGLADPEQPEVAVAPQGPGVHGGHAEDASPDRRGVGRSHGVVRLAAWGSRFGSVSAWIRT